MSKKSNADKIAERRMKQKQKIGTNSNRRPNSNNVSIYNNGEYQTNPNTRVSNSKVRRKRKKINKKKPFKAYIVVLIIAILILIVSIISSNRTEDVSKFFYLNNKKITTKVPVKISLAQNSTAKVAILSLDDIRQNFDENIRYNAETREIITIGKTHVARIILNDYGIDLNGTESVINVSAFEENGIVYIPLNDLSSVYGIEVFVTSTNKVLVDEIHKEKKILKVLANTKLKKGKGIFSKTITKLLDYEDYVLVEEGKNKLKIRTLEGDYGYISAKKSKSIIEIRSDYIEDEIVQYNIIKNYRNPEDNYDNVELIGGYNAAIIEVFKLSSKDSNIVLKQKYSSTESSYKIFREKLQSNNIDAVAELNLEEYNLEVFLETFEKRQQLITELLKIANKHNVRGIELLVDDNSKIELYENLIEELKPRLKERGLKLFLPNGKLKNERIKEIIDYES